MDILRAVLRNIRLTIALVVGVPILVIAGVMTAVEWWSGEGTLLIEPSPGESVSVSIDGMPPFALGEGSHYHNELPQGAHHVTVVGPMGQSSFDLAVSNGMWRALVPTSPQQCWVDLDVYDFYYGRVRGLPTIEARHPATAPIPVSSGTHFDEATLPSSVQESTTVHMMIAVPCTMLQVPDAQLVSALGFAI